MAKLTANGVTIEGTPEELAVIMERFSTEADVVESVGHTFSEGDKVRVNNYGEFGGVDIGEIGTVGLSLADENDAYSVKVEGDDDHDYFRPKDLEKLTEAEELALKVGDYAVVVEDATVTTLAVGDVVKIDERGIAYDFRTSRVSDGENEPFNREDLIRATEAEVASAKAQAEADEIERKRTEVFTSNGRKVNEYREGDIVRIAERSSSCNVIGDIGEVTEIYNGRQIAVQVNGKPERGNFTQNSKLEPLVFVENRLDR